MMRFMQFKSHWRPEDAYNILMLLDELRGSIWDNYRDEIIEYCHHQKSEDCNASSDIDDDLIPF